MSILVLNAGSSSLKAGLFSAECERLAGCEIDWAKGDRSRARLKLRSRSAATADSEVSVPDDVVAARCAIEAVLRCGGVRSRDVLAVGHRVVHGGDALRETSRIDSGVEETISRLCPLAPLHNPPALRGIAAARAALPHATQVAVFDTAFFSDLPQRAYLYPVPYEWHERWGIRRFGFHGLSHGWCAARATELLRRPPVSLRLITCHLGGGCSAAAVAGGKPVATTMGFSPLEGLMMGTRCGSVDPGVLLHIQREAGLSLGEVDQALNCSSGLLGVSGVSPDMAEIEKAAAAGNPRAQLAFEMFADRVRSTIGALAATLGGLEALVFTDRIGVGSAALRARVCAGLEFMGLTMEASANAGAVPDCDVAAQASKVRVFVIHTEEELVVARETRRVGLTVTSFPARQPQSGTACTGQP